MTPAEIAARRQKMVDDAEAYAAACATLQSRIARRRAAVEHRDADPVRGAGIGISYVLLMELDNALGAASRLLDEMRAILAAEAQRDG